MSLVFSERLRAAFAPPQYIALPFAGIDLSASGVKAVRLIEGQQGLTITHYLQEKLPEGAFVDGEVVDRAAVVKALRAAASATGISAANVALPESKSYLFETSASGNTKAELRTSLEQHIDEFVPLPPAEIVFDFVTGEKDEHGNTRVVGTGLARHTVEDILSVFEEAGISVRALEGEVYASARTLFLPDDDSTTLVIDIGQTTTKISIVTRRAPRFATTIHIGGHALTLAVQKYFGVTEDEARKVKLERGIVPSIDGNVEFLAAMLSTVSAIRDEISRHLAYWQDRAGEGGLHEPVSRVFLIGGHAAVRGLPEYLEEALHVPVMAGDVFTNLSSHNTWAPVLDKTESIAYATSIGLALRDHVTSFVSRDLTNLLPAKQQKDLLRNYRLRLGVVVMLLGISLILDAAILLSPTYVFLLGSTSAKETGLKNVTSALASSEGSALSERLTALTNKASTLTALTKKKTASSVLRDTLAVPREGISLTGFTFAPAADRNKNALTLTGTAKTRDALRAYQLALQETPFVLTANLPVSAYAKDADIAFTIALTLKP